MKPHYTAYIDGASSGNPGDAGIGIVVYRGDEAVLSISKYIGKQTNNYAEYTALLTLIEALKKHGVKEAKVYSDSELVVRQLSGVYKIKNEALKILASRIQAERKTIKLDIAHVPREQNKEADKLAKAASVRAGGNV